MKSPFYDFVILLTGAIVIGLVIAAIFQTLGLPAWAAWAASFVGGWVWGGYWARQTRD